MENEVKKTSKIWIIPTIIAAILLVALIVFMVIMGKGTTAVADGTQTLAESVAPLQDGTAQLSEGVDQYTEGVDQVADGVAMLNDNVPALSDGVQQLADGAVALNKGVNVGSGSLAVGVKTLHDNGTKLADGLIGMLNSLAENTTTYSNAATNLAGTEFSVSAPEAAQNAMQNKVLAKTTDYTQATITYAAASDTMALGGVQKWEADDTTKNGTTNQGLYASMEQLFTIAGKGIAVNQQTFDVYVDKNAAIATLSAGLQQNKVPEPTATAMATGAVTAVEPYITEALKGTAQYKNAYIAEQQALTKQVTDLSTFAGAVGAATALATVRSQMIDGGITYDSMNVLKKGVADLNKGVNGKGGLAEGVKQLQAGTAQLNAGVPTLSDGVKQLYDGTQQLKDNSDALRDGAKTLKDSAPALIDGIGQLVDGAKQVKGMVPGNK